MPISYFRWQSYPWKNELALQSKRVIIHFAEILLDDFDGEHNPMDMLDRAIILAAFAMRRMFEKRLVTDKLAGEKIPVRIFERSNSGDFRSPFIGNSGGRAFLNYEFTESKTKYLKISEMANEIIHSSQMMFVHGEEIIPDGLLIASDFNLKNRLLHFTIEAFSGIIQRVLDDRVFSETDQWDSKTGKVSAHRD
jgi:hypothetical protein